MDFDQKTRDLKYLEDKVFERFEIDTLERKDLEKKIVNYLDEKTNNLRIELNRELNNRAESINNLKGCLEVLELVFYLIRVIYQSCKRPSEPRGLKERKRTMNL